MNPQVAKRWMLRTGWLAVAASGVWMYLSYGLLRVPAGMDTMPDTHPPSTLCLIQKRPSQVPRGAVVFLDVEGGATLLTRVVGTAPDGALTIQHDNRASRFAHLEREAFTLADVRGLVVTMFVEDPQGVPDLGK